MGAHDVETRNARIEHPDTPVSLTWVAIKADAQLREALAAARRRLNDTEAHLLASGYYAHLPYPARHAEDGGVEAREIRRQVIDTLTRARIRRLIREDV